MVRTVDMSRTAPSGQMSYAFVAPHHHLLPRKRQDGERHHAPCSTGAYPNPPARHRQRWQTRAAATEPRVKSTLQPLCTEQRLEDEATTSRQSVSLTNGSAAEAVGAGADGKDHGDALLIGKLACLCVAILWGSYAPALRLVYSMDGPPGPVAVMLFRGVLQAAVLLTADAIATTVAARSVSAAPVAGNDAADGSANSSSSKAAAEAGPLSSATMSTSAEGSSTRSSSSTSWLVGLQDNPVLLGGLELGLWNFLATSVQTVGLQLTTATKAGFLIASTSLFTPLLSTLLGERPRLSTWIGSFVALAGTVLIVADKLGSDGGDAASDPWVGAGDAAILVAAFCYSLATVRLSAFARVVPPVKLAAAKSLVLASAAVCTALAAVWTMDGDVEQLWPGWRTSSSGALVVLCWSALGPGALAAFLHAKGQSIVPAADAQVIFSSTPLWSAAAAWALLGGEPATEKTWIGGGAIVLAGIIASRSWRK